MIEFSRKILEEAIGSDVKIFPVSAKFSLDVKLSGSDGLIPLFHGDICMIFKLNYLHFLIKCSIL